MEGWLKTNSVAFGGANKQNANGAIPQRPLDGRNHLNKEFVITQRFFFTVALTLPFFFFLIVWKKLETRWSFRLIGTWQNKCTANNLKACRTLKVLCSFGVDDYVLALWAE